MKPFEASGHACDAPSGTAYLKVELVAGQSAATSVWSRSPMRLLVPRSRGDWVWAFMSSLGGGLVAGDQYRVELEVGQGARCYLGTQASTKVYRNPLARPCGQRLHIALDEGACLVFAPDPVQAFAGACYTQQQEFRLHPESGLIAVDWVCSGRMARGERWAFSNFRSRNEVFVGPKRVLLDSMVMDQELGALKGAHRAGRFNCLALIVILGSCFSSASTKILSATDTRPVERRGSLICCASPISTGVLLRIAGESVEHVTSEIRDRLGFLTDLLGDDPWSRKW